MVVGIARRIYFHLGGSGVFVLIGRGTLQRLHPPHSFHFLNRFYQVLLSLSCPFVLSVDRSKYHMLFKATINSAVKLGMTIIILPIWDINPFPINYDRIGIMPLYCAIFHFILPVDIFWFLFTVIEIENS